LGAQHGALEDLMIRKLNQISTPQRFPAVDENPGSDAIDL
jgi:hypothetical protein